MAKSGGKAPTPGSLHDQAVSETNAQIGLESAPYESQIAGLQGGQQQALGQMNALFGNLLPYARDAAKFVADFYQKGLAQEKGIFETATGRLNLIRAQRAAQAQQMAQQMGGPVNVEAFLAPLNTSMVELPNASANTLFHSNMLAQGGVQEAEAFAGRVFPLLQAEQNKQIQMMYQNQIAELQAQVAAIKASAAGRTQTRLDELTQQEREYQLALANQKLDRLKADRDWRIAQQNLAMQKQAAADQRANLLGYYDKPYRYVDKQGKVHTGYNRIYTQSERQYREDMGLKTRAQTEEERSNRADEAISFAEMQARKADAAATRAHNQQAIAQSMREQAAKYLDVISQYNTTSKEVTHTRYDIVPQATINTMSPAQKGKLIQVNLTAEQAAQISNGAIKKAGLYWVKPSTVTETVSSKTDLDQRTPGMQSIIENPSDAYRYLVGHGIPKGLAVEMVRKRYSLGTDWDPGERYDPGALSVQQINALSFNALRREAVKRGWKPSAQQNATLNTLRLWMYRFYGIKPAVDYSGVGGYGGH